MFIFKLGKCGKRRGFFLHEIIEYLSRDNKKANYKIMFIRNNYLPTTIIPKQMYYFEEF